MDDGGVEVFTGYGAQRNHSVGPTKDGIYNHERYQKRLNGLSPMEYRAKAA